MVVLGIFPALPAFVSHRPFVPRSLSCTRVYQSLLKTAVLAYIATITALPCLAQDSFSLRNVKQQKWPEAEARRIYQFASQAVQREFRAAAKPFRPHFTLVLGADKDQMDINTNELRLVKWNKEFFAEGVVLFSFEQMLPADKKYQLTHRALSEAEATVNLQEARGSENCPSGVGSAGACP